jgi:ribosomal protein S18 acetylase RimI-like enzyme
MKTLLDESRQAGFAFIELNVFSSNPGAIHLYEKMGFKQVGRVPNKVIRNGIHIDDIIMIIEL